MTLLWERRQNEHMSDMQKKDNKEATESKEERSVEAQTPIVERTFAENEWSAEVVKQSDTHVIFKVYCKDTKRDWYQLIVRCEKKKFKKIGV